MTRTINNPIRALMIALAIIVSAAFIAVPTETQAASKKPSKVTGTGIYGGNEKGEKIINGGLIYGSAVFLWDKAKRADYYQIQVKYNRGAWRHYKTSTGYGDIDYPLVMPAMAATCGSLRSNSAFQYRIRAVNKVGKKKYYGKWSTAKWGKKAQYKKAYHTVRGSSCKDVTKKAKKVRKKLKKYY